MGIFTDYGRYVKAREFKKFCNSGGGVWFAFGAGGHQWNTENIPKAPPCNSRQLSDQNNPGSESPDGSGTPGIEPIPPSGSTNPKYRPCPCGCGCMIESPVVTWGTEDGDWHDIPTFEYTLPVMMILTTTRTEPMVKYLSEHPLCMQLNPEGKAELYFAYDNDRDPLFVSSDTRISARQILKAYHDQYDSNAYAMVFRDYFLTNGKAEGDSTEYYATRSAGKPEDDDTEKGLCFDLSGLRHSLIQFATVAENTNQRLSEKPDSKKPVLNPDGTQKTEARLDEFGNIVLDSNGLPIYDPVWTDWSEAELLARRTARYHELKAQPFLVLTDYVRDRSNDRRNRPTTEDESSGSTVGTGNKPISTEYSDIYEDREAARYLNGYTADNKPYGMPLTDMERDRNYPIFPVAYLDDLNSTDEDYNKPLFVNNGVYYNTRSVTSDGYTYSDEVQVPLITDKEKYAAFQRRRHRWILSGWYNAFNFLTFVHGTAELVCEAEKEAADTFLYGGRFWRLATDDMFPTYVLLRVNLNPFAISKYPEVDRSFIVKQIAIYHMKDAASVDVMRAEDYVFDVGQAVPDGTGKSVIDQKNLEMMMNDYMISAERVANQIDRYGYIIGF